MFEKHFHEAEAFIERLKNAGARPGTIDPVNDISNEEFYEWFEQVGALVHATFPEETEKWQKLCNERADMVSRSMKEHGIPFPGYINHLKRTIQYLNHLETRYNLKKEGAQKASGEDTPFKVLMGLINKTPVKIRYVIIIAVILAIAVFAVWSSLPDTNKTEIIHDF